MNGHATDDGAGRLPGDPPPVLAPTEAAVLPDPAADRQRKKEEFRTWLFLAFVLAPILAVLIVSAYGFAVWIFQLFVGPPGSH